MCDYITRKNEKGETETVAVARLNRLGLPQYFDVKYVFNSVLNELHDIESKSELIERLNKLKDTDNMYRYLYDKIRALSASAKNDANDQQLYTQIFNIIKSAKQEFELAKSTTDNQGNYNITILATDSEYAAKNYRREWSDMFYGGASLFVK
jgi:50S ribosomal subunit-associated GTPase HflX